MRWREREKGLTKHRSAACSVVRRHRLLAVEHLELRLLLVSQIVEEPGPIARPVVDAKWFEVSSAQGADAPVAIEPAHVEWGNRSVVVAKDEWIVQLTP